MSTPPIAWLGMSRPHYDAGRPGPIRALVIHATAGSHPGDLAWLRQGGSDAKPVSIHYYIDKAGAISQLVRDRDTAWHAGISQWRIDGRSVSGLNACSIGVELSNHNDGQDPYPAVQIASLISLAQALVARYAIPATQVVRHVDIAPGRKTDPAGFPWPSFLGQVFLATAAHYSETSPIVGQSRATLAQARAYVLSRPHGAYTAYDLGEVILPAYFAQCAELGIPAEIAVAQAIHETNNFASDWAARPHRNPAGIGVDGSPGAGCSFADWVRESVPAHLGRLLAYALTANTATTLPQEAAIRYALRVRPLGGELRGSAQILRELGAAHNPTKHGWATPGTYYGAAIAEVADAIRSQSL
jgi:hypothetical protein